MTGRKSEAMTAAEAFRRRDVTPLQRVRYALHRYPQISPLVVLLIGLAVFAVVNPRFLLPSNLSLILEQVSIIGSLAIGETIIILTAGIDLSVGALMILVTMIIGTLAGHF